MTFVVFPFSWITMVFIMLAYLGKILTAKVAAFRSSPASKAFLKPSSSPSATISNSDFFIYFFLNTLLAACLKTPKVLYHSWIWFQPTWCQKSKDKPKKQIIIKQLNKTKKYFESRLQPWQLSSMKDPNLGNFSAIGMFILFRYQIVKNDLKVISNW